MTVEKLSRDEKLALVALTELAVISDLNITDEEVAKVDEIVEALGEETFQELAEEAERRFADRNALKAFLKGITSQEAREIIFGTVLSESLVDTMPHEQAEFMQWLSTAWNVSVVVEGGTDA
jgi:hypothetical protein